jgi:hypothetical protein
MKKLILLLSVLGLMGCQKIQHQALKQDQLCRGMIRSYLQLNGSYPFDISAIKEAQQGQKHILSYRYRANLSDVDTPIKPMARQFDIECTLEQQQISIDFGAEKSTLARQLQLLL